MLKNQKVRNAFTEIAKEYSNIYTTAWFLQDASPGHERDLSCVTDDFLQNILDKFPLVFVDDG